jgi:8-oxo-dGTP pyrophosphatase MutT (NUDIX family)
VPDDVLLAADHPALRPSDDLADARQALASADIDPAAEQHRTSILGFLADHDDALHRSCTRGHLTGSALVVDATGERFVVLHHRKLQRWLQPGGHCDGDANLAAVALREATEETGLDGLRVHPVAIDLDVHEVRPPAEGPHLHLDARYLVVAPPDADLEGNHESTDIRWVTEADLGELDVDEGTVRMVRHGLDRHRRLVAA